MADLRTVGDRLPLATISREQVTDFSVKLLGHSPKIAKHCYSSKQHFARQACHAASMSRTPINDALAANLTYYMRKQKWTQKTLGEKSKMGQTTVGLYLHPERRKPGKTGKPGSAKLTEVEMLADTLGVEVWQLLRPMTDSERAAYDQIEAAFNALKKPVTSEPTTTTRSASLSR